VIPLLLNLLLIMTGPFLVVGGVAAVAEVCGANLRARMFPAPRRSRPAMRWAVA